ncbi:DNA processing protein DprA [Maricaulis sp. W15]|uniref:DNA-processing protein DprA n=1 Tax=Maricaulis sp. W15 TaxID=1772333 RepID=UPI000948DD6E|nr:DNA-processing protein DprA [Maricaulis sp. W15]OLF73167.1 DNA processing protein DprA [Maricaulis sp. W15]
MTDAGASHTDRVMWLRLARTRGLGATGFARAIARYGSAEDALDDLPARARAAGRRNLDIPPVDRVEAELEQVNRAGARLICGFEPDYPALLTAIPDPPPAIIVRGDTRLFQRPACALVGARNASAVGLRFARELANGLGREDVVIVSGLARGIDGAAHAGALSSGTIAVLAGGIDHVYPPEHAALHAQIAERGLLLSEMPLGRTPTARDFPRRNRIISGLSLGSLVVEAALRSGSLITARYAGEQGREVMSVPGSPLDPRARGSNQLLRDGAHLIETVDDVLAVLAEARPPSTPTRHVEDCSPPDPDDFFDEATEEIEMSMEAVPARANPLDRLRALLSPAPVSSDELARAASLPAGQVQALLMEMEMRGEIASLPGGLVQRRRRS